MNLLMTIHHKLDANAGAPGVTLKLAGALRARGHRVDLLSHDDMPLFGGVLRSVLFPWLVLYRVARRPDYDVLDMSAGDGWVVNLLRQVFGWRPRQLAATRSHGMEPLAHAAFLEACRRGAATKSWKYPLYHGGLVVWQCTKSFAWADLALVLNDTEYAYTRERLGLGEARVALVANGIDEYFAAHACAALQRIDGKPVPAPRHLAFVGRASYWKGIDTLVQGVTRVLRRYPDATLKLVGTGEPAAVTLARFDEAVRAQVSALQQYDNTRLPEILSDCQILAYPARFDGFPLAPMEAMACGLVPVTSNHGALRAYVRDGENGLLVAPDDPDALGIALESLLDDPARWAVLRRGALETVSGYAWPELARRFELLYAARWQHNSGPAAA